MTGDVHLFPLGRVLATPGSSHGATDSVSIFTARSIPTWPATPPVTG
jgi:hypothetical protein